MSYFRDFSRKKAKHAVTHIALLFRQQYSTFRNYLVGKTEIFDPEGGQNDTTVDPGVGETMPGNHSIIQVKPRRVSFGHQPTIFETTKFSYPSSTAMTNHY